MPKPISLHQNTIMRPAIQLEGEPPCEPQPIIRGGPDTAVVTEHDPPLVPLEGEALSEPNPPGEGPVIIGGFDGAKPSIGFLLEGEPPREPPNIGGRTSV